LSFLVVSPSVSKLREFEKIRPVNTFETASTTEEMHSEKERNSMLKICGTAKDQMFSYLENSAVLEFLL